MIPMNVWTVTGGIVAWLLTNVLICAFFAGANRNRGEW